MGRDCDSTAARLLSDFRASKGSRMKVVRESRARAIKSQSGRSCNHRITAKTVSDIRYAVRFTSQSVQTRYTFAKRSCNQTLLQAAAVAAPGAPTYRLLAYQLWSRVHVRVWQSAGSTERFVCPLER